MKILKLYKTVDDPVVMPLDRQPSKSNKELLSMDEEFLNRLQEAIEERIDDPDFNVDALGVHIGMSRSQIHRKLQKITGQSASRFIRTYKLRRARDYLRSNSGTVSEIAYWVGFSSPTYFGQVYVEEFGYPPSEELRIGKTTFDNRQQPERQLAVIVATSFANYSKTLAEDEGEALRLLGVFQDIHRKLIEEFGGKIWRESSGEIVASFGSPTDSIVCAKAIIKKSSQENIPIRIGIHEGEIVIDEKDIIGEGIDVAR